MNENCLDCINFKNEKCTLRPGECINYNHFRWTSLVQISQNDLETKYVSRISFDDMKSRAEKAEGELVHLKKNLHEWKFVTAMMADELTEANSKLLPVSWEDASENSPAWIAYVNLRDRNISTDAPEPSTSEVSVTQDVLINSKTSLSIESDESRKEDPK